MVANAASTAPVVRNTESPVLAPLEPIRPGDVFSVFVKGQGTVPVKLGSKTILRDRFILLPEGVEPNGVVHLREGEKARTISTVTCASAKGRIVVFVFRDAWEDTPPSADGFRVFSDVDSYLNECSQDNSTWLREIPRKDLREIALTCANLLGMAIPVAMSVD